MKTLTLEQIDNLKEIGADASCFMIERSDVASMFPPRPKYSDKRNFGSALMIAGSKGMVGAAILSSRSCLRSGVGLLTLHSPACAYQILQTSVPEAMVECDEEDDEVSSLNIKTLSGYNAIGVGPGLGRSDKTLQVIKQLLQFSAVPLVIDADAINLIAENPTYLEFLPVYSVFTPHSRELERLIGKTSNAFERMEKTRRFAARHNTVVIIKGANTSVVCPDSKVFVNSTGNPGMSTAGSGDVLSGIILSFLAQGFSPEQAALAAVYIHGLSGDIALENQSEQSMIASDVINNMGKAFKILKTFNNQIVQ